MIGVPPIRIGLSITQAWLIATPSASMKKTLSGEKPGRSLYQLPTSVARLEP